ncbi:S41 family peptidase [Salibacteraceae bacterium]|jgi:carboxyl-terminal processing protease|nr:S41 family peptidase [Salibacteraceae bacterium]
MNRIKSLSTRIKILLIAAIVGATSFFSLSFTDSYFEISKNMEIFAKLFQELNIYYVDETKPGELIKTGIDAMLRSLDPYTVYYPEEKIEDFKFLTTGQYGGIGSLIRKKDDYVMIAEPYEGFPAQKAGLRAGDVVLEVDGQDVKGKTTSEMSGILKGQAKSELVMKIKRPFEDEIITKTLTREDIKIEDVPYHGILDEGVGYLRLSSFTQTASGAVRKAIVDLKKEGMTSLVFDLRGNGGGLLREAVEIVNLFVPKGVEVVSTKGKLKNWDRSYKTSKEPLDMNMPVCILIDEGSASASEIVAGALQDLDRAVIIGQKSFGKGLVQQTLTLSYNTRLKVTVSKYYIPSGRCIQKIDYTHKENGKAQEIPDSLAAEFATKRGRVVYDAGGIYPDIKTGIPTYSNIAQDLSQEDLIFDFATEYRSKNDSLEKPESFRIDDELYAQFESFLEGKDLDYKTESEELLDKLAEASKKEKYFENIQTEYQSITNRIAESKGQDLVKHKAEIVEILTNELVSRYYYQKGRIISSLSTDDEIIEAKKVLKDRSLYDSILDGSFAKKD